MKMKTERQKKTEKQKKTCDKNAQKFLGKSHRNNKQQSANLLDCQSKQLQIIQLCHCFVFGFVM